jgi:acetoacetyl-CoA synthetase
MAQYQAWLTEHHGLTFGRYDDLWHWSVTDLPAFWQSIWDHFDLQSPKPHSAVLALPESGLRMPGAQWFSGAQVNYAQQVLRHADTAHAAGHPAIVYQDESRQALGLPPHEMRWPELQRQVAVLATRFTQFGIQPGDRICAYLPNTPQTVVAFLACASVGALWSVCSPDMGPVAVLDRFQQIEPKLLLAVDSQVWGGTTHDRLGALREVAAGLPSLQHLVLMGDVDVPGPWATHRWAALVAGEPPAGWAPAWLPFEHPLWIVYSSGTTGLPKAIVHGHGGIVLEALKGTLHNDIHPSAATGERFFWFSSTGWIMWNAQVAALLGGTTICLFDGNPGGSSKTPDWGVLWRFAGAAGVTWFGAGAAFYASCLKAGVQPMQEADLSRLQAVGSTGSPLSDECYDWIWHHLPQPGGQRIWLNPVSGGTDFAGAFVAGHRGLPVVKGEMQCRCLGAAIHAFSEDGQSLIDAVGELVCTQPMPSMPLYFWNDTGGQRYRDSYFDMFPGGSGQPAAWRHGDWIRITPCPVSGDPSQRQAHGAIIYGRSDATINRHGIRMGTAELYRAVEVQPEVLDSLVVDLEYLGRESWMPLFVVLREGQTLDAALQQRLRSAIRQALSARHVPSDIFQVAAIPRTLSGKKMELPVKKLLQGAAPEAVFKRDAMANADCVDWFADLARQRAGQASG